MQGQDTEVTRTRAKAEKSAAAMYSYGKIVIFKKLLKNQEFFCISETWYINSYYPCAPLTMISELNTHCKICFLYFSKLFIVHIFLKKYTLFQKIDKNKICSSFDYLSDKLVFKSLKNNLDHLNQDQKLKFLKEHHMKENLKGYKFCSYQFLVKIYISREKDVRSDF